MSGKGTNGSAKGSTPAAVNRSELIRNVALVGHSGSGKTTLLEAILASTGAITRMGTVADGTTVSDSDPAAVHQQRSVTLSVAPVMSSETKVNFLDTPGYADFVGELRAGLRAADGALFVVSAAEDIDAATISLWGECERVRMPRAVVISKLDHPRADYQAALARCQAAFGESVLPLYVPVTHDGALAGLLGLLTRTVSDYSGASGEAPGSVGMPEMRPAREDELAGWDEARGALIEGIIGESEDETLMDRYLGGEDIGLETIVGDLEKAIARGSFFPVVPASALGGGGTAGIGTAGIGTAGIGTAGISTAGIGTAEVLEVLRRGFPSPVEHPLPRVTDLEGKPVKGVRCDPEGPLVGEVVRTTVDPFLGRVCLVRLFSGTLREDTPVHVAGHGLADRGHPDHDADERLGHLYTPFGATLQAAPYAVAGDLCAVARLGAETGDTVSAKEAPMLVAPWTMPEPLMPVAIEAASHGDEDALAKSLAKVAAGDPTLRVERNAETHQLVLWCMGEAHADVVLDRLREQGVKLATVDVVTPLRETFAGAAVGHGRHVKQSGGHGQYAICDIEVEPLERGGGFEFVDRIVGGVIPKTFIESVEKGVRAQMARGVAEGFPVVDIKVTLVGGKTHSVDSSDAAFQAAGALALREAAAATRIQLLEPVSSVTISVPDDYVGAVMSDLSSRRGRLTGTISAGCELTDISAEVPDAELLRYAVELRGLTAGTGTFRREYLRHDPVAR